MILVSFPGSDGDEGARQEEATALIAAACARMRARQAEVTEQMMRAIVAGVPEYRGLPGEALADIRSGIEAVFGLVVATIETGIPPPGERFELIAAQRAQQRIPFQVLLRGFEVGHHIGWRILCDHLAEMATSSALPLAYTLAGDRLVAAIHELHRRAESGHRSARERLESGVDRRRLHALRDLLSGRFASDRDMIGDLAAVGVDLKSPYALAVLATVDDRRALHACAASAAAAIRGSFAVPFLDEMSPHLAVLVPSTPALWSSTRRHLVRAVARHPTVAVTAVLEPAVWTPSAYHDAYARLLDVATFLPRLSARYVGSAALANVLSVIRHDPAVLRRFVRGVCGDLLTERPRRQQAIAETGVTYFRRGQRAADTARARRITDRTVRDHLAQLATLTGREPTHDHLRLALALTLLPLAGLISSTQEPGDDSLEALLTDDVERRDDFVRATSGQLLELPLPRRVQLVTTVLTYYSTGHNARATAAMLGVHTSTVHDRLRAVADLTQLNTTRDHLRLALALELLAGRIANGR